MVRFVLVSLPLITIVSHLLKSCLGEPLFAVLPSLMEEFGAKKPLDLKYDKKVANRKPYKRIYSFN